MDKVNLSKAVVSWSSGKDCAFALHQVQEQGQLEIVGLLTTFNQENNRVAMHGVRRELVQLQMEALALPAEMVMLPMPCDEETYRQRIGRSVERLRAGGVNQIIFGDLYLEDIRRYREKQMRDTGIEPAFPLWQRDTRQLARDMVDCGLQAVVTCVDLKQLDADFVGRRFDHDFIDQLPDYVDPCGENGEFHTLATAGPMFTGTLAVKTGEKVRQGDFVYIDIYWDNG
jgi:uncharacterized protein (TIGR00290 family)